MGGSSDSKQQHGNDEPQRQGDNREGGGNSGHGAASAMAQMISQEREHRHQTGEADDAAGGTGQ